MTAAADLIAEVHAHGGRIGRDGDRIDLAAPRPLPADLVERLRAAKPDVLAALAGAPPCRLPPALVLKDGRRFYRIPSHRHGRTSAAAVTAIASARAVGIVLAAHGDTLEFTAPPTAPADMLAKIVTSAADVLATLHREADARMVDRRDGAA